MYRKVLLSSFHNGKVEYCTTSGSGDIEENATLCAGGGKLIKLANFNNV